VPGVGYSISIRKQGWVVHPACLRWQWPNDPAPSKGVGTFNQGGLGFKNVSDHFIHAIFLERTESSVKLNCAKAQGRELVMVKPSGRYFLLRQCSHGALRV
jgi:hypothetical protein